MRIKSHTPRGARRFVLVLLLSLIALPVQASFVVENGSSELIDGALNTSARLNLSITGDPEIALSKGISLTLVVQSELHRASLASLFFKVESWQDRYRIEYQGLSNRFTLTRLRDGSTRDFATLSETLSSLERYSDQLRIPDGVSSKDKLQIRMRVVLDRGELPGPLRLLALVLPEWRLDGSWGRWMVASP